MTEFCPYCGSAVLVRGRVTHFHWCNRCELAVDPVRESNHYLDEPAQAHEPHSHPPRPWRKQRRGYHD
jgi:hypothetical protein